MKKNSYAVNLERYVADGEEIYAVRKLTSTGNIRDLGYPDGNMQTCERNIEILTVS